MECEMLIKKLLLMVDQIKKDLNTSSWLHMPPTSFKYQYLNCYAETLRQWYHYLGVIASLDQTEATYRISITYYQKVQAICNLLGLKEKSQLDRVMYCCAQGLFGQA